MSTATRASVNGARPERELGLLSPDERAPFWRRPDGTRLTYDDARLAAGPEREADVARVHADAICALVAAAATTADADTARALASAAARLCGEVIGLWPRGSWEPAR